MPSSPIRLVLIGLGNVGRNFAALLKTQADLLQRRGLNLVLVGAADTSGAALAAGGLDPAILVQLKQAGQGAAAYPGAGCPGLSPLELIAAADADLLCEASLTNLRDGEPGLSCIRAALDRK